MFIKESNNLNQYLEIALEAAVEASAEIMIFYNNRFKQYDKTDGSPVTDADLASSKIIIEKLSTTKIPIICEEIENKNYKERKNWSYNWCVDPLDGTKEYIKKNDEFSVNIALIHNHQPILGVIASPVEKKIIFSVKEFGVFTSSFENYTNKNLWKKIHSIDETNEPLRLIASRSHFGLESDIMLDHFSTKIGMFDFHQKGSALKFFDLAKNQADIYVRFMPTMEWDIAAGQIILEELGGQIINYETQETMIYNKESLVNPNFIALTKGAISLNLDL